ncbi:MAG TPA: 3-ketoacyl-ACP reductase [Bacteroidota bacterium]
MPEPPVVLVTGASRGLGRGIALRLAELGMSVALNYAGNGQAARETEGRCRQAAPSPEQRFLPIKADLALTDERERLVQEALGAFGRIDALVSNAGIGPRVRNDMTATTEASFQEVLQVNLTGAFFLTQRLVAYWLEARPKPLLPHGFKIVFNSSISAASASTNRPEYCISKAGLAMAAQLWAVRLAGEGIQVYEIRPGIMATDMTSAVRGKYDAMIAEGRVPQRRWGTPEDAGLAVGALLTGDFPYSTGAVIYVDGGLHLPTL